MVKHIVCPKCKYDWNYKGKLNMASCPNCSHKFKLKSNQKKESENAKKEGLHTRAKKG